MDKNLNINNRPTVSVVMSCYNGERFIAEAIESVLSQTFVDFEFIIWDDGSTDGSAEVIKKYSDPRIRYFYHENSGLGKALKLACAECRGKYIARIDSDDVCLPNRFAREVEFLNRHEDYVLVSSAVYFIDVKGNIIGRNYPYTENRIIKEIIEYSNPIVHPASMFRRDIYNQTLGYQDVWGCEDILLWKQLNRLGKIGNLAEPLIKYRLEKSSIMHQKYGHPYKDVMLALTKKIIKEGGMNVYDNHLLLDLKKKKQEQPESEVNVFYRRSMSVTIGKKLEKILGGRCANFIIFFKNKLWFIKNAFKY